MHKSCAPYVCEIKKHILFYCLHLCPLIKENKAIIASAKQTNKELAAQYQHTDSLIFCTYIIPPLHYARSIFHPFYVQ